MHKLLTATPEPPQGPATQLARRDAMRLSGLGALGVAAPPATRPARAAEAPGPVMAEVSAHMAAAARTALPEAVAAAARHHLLDALAAMRSGAALLPG